jgi:hypothetical protein
VYFTQWNGAPAREKAPPVVYIDQGFGGR